MAPEVKRENVIMPGDSSGDPFERKGVLVIIKSGGDDDGVLETIAVMARGDPLSVLGAEDGPG
jgi:hypothetical protein